ncbi:uncharacterized protein BKCO1_500096 [Diplodia corticola]|uniref:Rhodopsin domain-containing protein n=1 Tax=Diplodia corticola TaxID=236234 RepID=A0A1J9RCZ2_9PEZI|nr:uncharacterized protein BKCO1_500096 [Diplodia corticola]OJD37978.1 hypothetical protein BKCO1_500096 [Diplodia corticola]
MANGDPSHEEVLVESIIFYVFALLLFIGRLWSRTITAGSIKSISSDDFVMIVTFLFYTALIVLLNFNVRFASNLMHPSELAGVLADPAQVKSRIFGSKITLAVEQCMIHAQWGTKASLLILYHKMTQGLRENLFNKICAAYVLLGYIIIQITFFGVWCRPFNQYWAINPDNEQCANYGNYCIMILVFNTTSDLLLMWVPIPLIWKAQMKRKKKIMLCAVFSLGIFNVIAAVLNKTYNWILPGSHVYMIWYVRESSTGIYVANATCCWPLFRKIVSATGLGGSWTNSISHGKGPDKYMYDEYGHKTALDGGAGTGGGRSSNRKSTLRSSQHFSKLRSVRDRTMHSLHSNSTHIGGGLTAHDGTIRRGSADGGGGGGRDVNGSQEAINSSYGEHTSSMPLEIWRQVDYDIESGLPRTPSMYAEDNKYNAEAKGGDIVMGLRNDVVTTTVTEVRGGRAARGHVGRKESEGSSSGGSAEDGRSGSASRASSR